MPGELVPRRARQRVGNRAKGRGEGMDGEGEGMDGGGDGQGEGWTGERTGMGVLKETWFPT